MNHYYKAFELSGRYVNNSHIKPLIDQLPENFNTEVLGFSKCKQPIYGINYGKGPHKVLMWSQMHGNESTTTKAVFDLCNYLNSNTQLSELLTIQLIPILNPDGAEAYTRVNAAEIDLNRDAFGLNQPESQLLRAVFDDFQPHYCLNLHDQRTIFSAGETSNSAVLSFLAPAFDEARSINATRRRAMELIGSIYKGLDDELPGQIGRYDDSFNINCVGDMFQSKGVPTILFEAGHYPSDYQREYTRYFVFRALVEVLGAIVNPTVLGTVADYEAIPQNEKCFYDILFKNASDASGKAIDVAVQYEERLKGGTISFEPYVAKIGDLSGYYGHNEIDAKGKVVATADGRPITEGYSGDSLCLENAKFSLNLGNI